MGVFIYVAMTNYSVDLFTLVFKNFNTSRKEIPVFPIYFLPVDSIFLHFFNGKHRLNIILIEDDEN